MERIQLNISIPQDEALVTSWINQLIAEEMANKEKCQEESQAKRLRSLVARSHPYIVR